MTHIKTTVILLLAAAGLLFFPAVAQAASAPTGMCLVTHIPQQPEAGKCSDIASGVKDNKGVPSKTKGTKLDATKCYSLTYKSSGDSIVTIPCNNKALVAAEGQSLLDGGSDGGGSGTSGSTGGSSSVPDPAYDANADVTCTENSCPLMQKYVNPAITLLSMLVGLVAVIAIIAGAIQVSTSAGDPQKASAGKDHIRNALIGLVAYVLLWAFLQWILPGGIGS